MNPFSYYYYQYYLDNFALSWFRACATCGAQLLPLLRSAITAHALLAVIDLTFTVYSANMLFWLLCHLTFPVYLLRMLFRLSCISPSQCTYCARSSSCFIRSGEVGLHVLTHPKGSFLPSSSPTAVAPPRKLPPTSRLTLNLVLVRAISSMPATLSPTDDGNCSSPTVYIFRILFAAPVFSHYHTLALLYTSAHCCPCHIGTVGKLFQYFYQALLTCFSQAAIAVSGHSLAFARCRSLINTS